MLTESARLNITPHTPYTEISTSRRYRIVGVAWDTRSHREQIVYQREDGGKMFLATVGDFAIRFVEVVEKVGASGPEAAGAKVIDYRSEGSGV